MTAQDNQHKLYSITGEIMGLGPSESSAQNTYYKHIWIRESNERQKTIQNVRAARELCGYLVTGKTVTLYLVQSPSGHSCLYAIDSGSAHAEAIEPIERDQAKAFRAGLMWLALSIPLCLVLVGFVLFPFTIRGLILLSKAPKAKDMRALVAAQHAAA